MDYFEDRYFGFMQKLMFLFGFWHTQTYRERLFRFCITGFVLLCSLLLQLCEFVNLEFNLRSVVSLLQTFIPSICFALLHLTAVIHYMTVQKLYNCMKQDWQRLRNDIELKIMQKYAYETKLFTLACGILFFLFGTLFILPPVLYKIVYPNEARSASDRFPILACVDYFLNPETYYYPILVQEIIGVIMILLMALACYSTFFSYIQHVCARLYIMKDQINQLFIKDQYKNQVLAEQMDLSHWIIDIIQRLAQTKEFMNLVNTISEKCYMIQVMLGFILLIIDFVCVPVLLEHKESRKDAFMFFIFIFTTLLPIYVNCYAGQRLMDYSTDVYEEACLIPIHEISLKTQKLLLTMLMMNAKPYALSIGNVFVASYEFFSDLLRTSLSFAMLVHSTQNM